MKSCLFTAVAVLATSLPAATPKNTVSIEGDRFVGDADAPGAPALGENKWNKVAILGHPAGWTWDTHADRGPPHPDAPVCRVFAAPGDYRIEFAGRSHGHAIDRLALRRVESPRPRLTTVEEKVLTALPRSSRQ